MVRFQLYICVIVTLSAVATHCSAASYQFVNIVDDAGPLDPNTLATINNSGTVAFVADRDAGGRGIFIGSGGAITTLYDSSGPFDGFGTPDINDSGTVAFNASLDAGGSGLFTGNGGPTTTITSWGEGNIQINNQGAVVFKNSEALYVGSGGPLTTIADTTGHLSGNLQARSINDSGTVGFSAWLDDVDGRGIFTGDGGPITTVALAGPGNPFAFVHGVEINNAGTVAFHAMIGESPDYLEAFFIGSPGSTTMVVDNDGPYRYFHPDLYIVLNNNGQVAFRATLDAGGEGIFTGPDPLADKVIQIGDPLFGSTLSFISTYALNDNGEIAFHYDLANGIRGIAVATPVPEPCGFVLATLGVCVVALSQRRGRQRQDKTKGGVNNIRSIG